MRKLKQSDFKGVSACIKIVQNGEVQEPAMLLNGVPQTY